MRHTTALACVVAAVASAGDPAAAQISHLGQHISDHVVLRDGAVSGRAEPDCPSTASFNNKALFRVWPDGTQASVPFTVPAARQLVITDVEWNVDALSSGFPLIPGGTVRTRLRIGSGTTFTPVFLSRTVEVGARVCGQFWGREIGQAPRTRVARVFDQHPIDRMRPRTRICPRCLSASIQTRSATSGGPDVAGDASRRVTVHPA
jgi:hypothetical protein